MGEDVWWWWLPTQPTYAVNYNERIFSKREVVSMYRTNQFKDDPKPDSLDPIQPIRKQQAFREKIFIFIMIFVVWEIITGVQTILLNDYSEKGDFMDERKKK